MALGDEVRLAGDPEEEEQTPAEEEEEEEEEEDLIDPFDEIKAKCRDMPDCQKLETVLDTCNSRVNSRPNTTETCMEELFDHIHCIDKCSSTKIFKQLK